MRPIYRWKYKGMSEEEWEKLEKKWKLKRQIKKSLVWGLCIGGLVFYIVLFSYIIFKVIIQQM